jgi:transcriptional regulator with XRE-family HTH domain
MSKRFTPPSDVTKFAKLLSSKVDLSAGYACDLARKNRTPSLEKAIEFEDAYGIPPRFWIERRTA